MRDFLCRGKRLSDNKWVHGVPIVWADGSVTIANFNNLSVLSDFEGRLNISGYMFPVDPNTVGEFTGLCDANGVRIFEGDKLLVQDDCTGDGYTNIVERKGVVVYSDACFCVEWEGGGLELYNFTPNKASAVVIGTIHDEVTAE